MKKKWPKFEHSDISPLEEIGGACYLVSVYIVLLKVAELLGDIN